MLTQRVSPQVMVVQPPPGGQSRASRLASLRYCVSDTTTLAYYHSVLIFKNIIVTKDAYLLTGAGAGTVSSGPKMFLIQYRIVIYSGFETHSV